MLLLILFALLTAGCEGLGSDKKKKSNLASLVTGNWKVVQIIHANEFLEETPDGAEVLYAFNKNLTFEIVYKINGTTSKKYDGTYTLLLDSVLHTYKPIEGGHDETKVIYVSEDTLKLFDTKKSKDILILVKNN